MVWWQAVDDGGANDGGKQWMTVTVLPFLYCTSIMTTPRYRESGSESSTASPFTKLPVSSATGCAEGVHAPLQSHYRHKPNLKTLPGR